MKAQPLGPLIVDITGGGLLPEEKEKLGHPLVGGIILFSRNYDCPQQLEDLVRDIKAVRKPEIIVAVDQEGGQVQRFREGFTRVPAARACGDLYDRDAEAGRTAAQAAGYLMSSELRSRGVDLSFAPVLDVATVDSAVIGDRSFHHDPQAVTELAGAYIEGMARGGMKATGKHFPGHGGVAGDSHTCLPCDHRDRAAIDRCDLLPYRALSSRLHGVMTAHVSFPEIDDGVPTFSRYWLRDVLRRDIGFEGVVFSDDLAMAGAEVAGDPVQRTTRALDAGCDMVLLCNDPAAVDLVLDRIEIELPSATPDRVLALAGGNADPSPRARALNALETLRLETA